MLNSPDAGHRVVSWARSTSCVTNPEGASDGICQGEVATRLPNRRLSAMLRCIEPGGSPSSDCQGGSRSEQCEPAAYELPQRFPPFAAASIIDTISSSDDAPRSLSYHAILPSNDVPLFMSAISAAGRSIQQPRSLN